MPDIHYLNPREIYENLCESVQLAKNYRQLAIKKSGYSCDILLSDPFNLIHFTLLESYYPDFLLFHQVPKFFPVTTHLASK